MQGDTAAEIIANNRESGFAVIGTPDDAVAKIEELVEASDGGFGAFLLFDHDWAPPAAKLHSYELFAQYVIPHFTGQLAGAGRVARLGHRQRARVRRPRGPRDRQGDRGPRRRAAGQAHPRHPLTPDQPDLAVLAQQRLEQWRLRADGPAVRDADALTVPVRTADGTPALLKVGASDSEHLVLRRWGGNGAVRLLRADPHERVLLTERVAPTTLDTLPDTRACEIVAGLYARLHVPALPQLASATAELGRWADRPHGPISACRCRAG